jgi:N-acetylglucosaminyldiphosphoundecaprenol N-acetyl-beta-D-mannosaminyltransferase
MIHFAGIQFRGLDKKELLNLTDNNLKVVATLNAEFIVLANEKPEFKKLLSNAFCTFDGQVPYLLARIKNPTRKFQKISGSDFIYDACSSAQEKNLKLFLLGGKEESNRIALEKIKSRYAGILADGFSPPFSPYPFINEIDSQIKNKISKFKPDIIFVGFGAEKQERWIMDNFDYLNSLGVKLAIGSGGTFEFVAGTLPRAPKVFQVLGLEGVFRLAVEPKSFRAKRLLKSFKIFKYFFY